MQTTRARSGPGAVSSVTRGRTRRRPALRGAFPRPDRVRSRNGASFQILSLVGTGRFVTCLSVPLVIEYEDGLKRQSRSLGLTHADIGDFLDSVCSVSERRQIYYSLASGVEGSVGRFRSRTGVRGWL